MSHMYMQQHGQIQKNRVVSKKGKMQHDMYNHLICVNQKQKAIALCIF